MIISDPAWNARKRTVGDVPAGWELALETPTTACVLVDDVRADGLRGTQGEIYSVFKCRAGVETVGGIPRDDVQHYSYVFDCVINIL